MSNVPVTPGSGANIATDLVGGDNYQVVKLDLGGSGASQPVSGAVPVSGTFWPATQPVSATALPLPAGAATAAKQPALGTAGAASADVLTVQGIAGGTPQPVSLAALPSLAAGSSLVGGVNLVDGAGTNKAAIGATGALDVRASQLVSIAVTPATSATVLWKQDCAELAQVSWQVTSAGTSCTITYEQSNDDITYFPSMAYPVSGVATTAFSPTSTSANSVGIIIPVMMRYVRARVSTYGSGTVTGIATGRAIPAALPGTSVVLLSSSSQIGNLGGSTAVIGDVGVQYRTNATGAASATHLIAAGSTNATVVKATPGRVLGWSLGNTSTGWRYVKLHNLATTPTAGANVARTIAIPPGGLSNLVIEGGIGFATGIGLTTVTGSADTDATAVAAGDIIGELLFA